MLLYPDNERFTVATSPCIMYSECIYVLARFLVV